ncbi:MAG TPA: transglutaminaseTgpA domain-containing protein [Bryobacteraceae bacterium]|nr:transglutaminaseTgpA domain-containing protein [Bryobacteraceae bacterium]
MSRPAARAPQSVERFFEFSLLGMLASGYLAVAGSGYLDRPTIVLTAIGLVIRALFVIGFFQRKLSSSWLNAATLAYIGFYPVDYLYISREFLPATVHLIFFLAVVRVLTASSNRDYFFVKLIAFLELVAASILSSSLNFFAFLVLFLLFGVATFCSSEIRRSAQEPRQIVRSGVRLFSWRLTALTAWVAAGIVLMTAGLFFLLPRTAQAAFQHIIAQRYHLPGFSNEVVLGQLGEIKKQSATVMHIRVEGAPQLPLKWRGAALANFDGKRWYNNVEPLEVLHMERGLVRLATLEQRRRMGRRISYEVRIKELDTDALFFAGEPEFLRIGLPSIVRMRGDGFRTGLGVSDGMHYFGISYLPDRSAQSGMAETPPGISSYLRLPEVDERIPALSRELSAYSPNDDSRARAIETYLRTKFGYTTDLLDEPVRDPLAHFLFDRRRGHCEYFASAMAVMLRTIGIPSRVVTGFQSGVYNPMTGWQVIRTADAHSWVEAYVQGRGWITYDPTPADPTLNNASFFSRVGLYLDAAETFWQDWVVHYDLDRQLILAARMEKSSRMFGSSWFDGGGPVRAAFDGALLAGRRWGVHTVGAMTAIALVLLAGPKCWAWWAGRRRVQRLLRGEVARNDAALLYLRMLDVLRRRGYEKPAWLTPSEFARVLPASPTAALVQELTDAYNNLRFGGRAEAGHEMVRLLREIEANA